MYISALFFLMSSGGAWVIIKGGPNYH
jgi:hypothetical protein